MYSGCVGGTSGVLDGGAEASQYTGGALYMTFAASGILAPGLICCFLSRALRFCRCFQSLNMLFNGTQTTLHIFDVNTA